MTIRRTGGSSVMNCDNYTARGCMLEFVAPMTIPRLDVGIRNRHNLQSSRCLPALKETKMERLINSCRLIFEELFNMERASE